MVVHFMDVNVIRKRLSIRPASNIQVLKLLVLFTGTMLIAFERVHWAPSKRK